MAESTTIIAALKFQGGVVIGADSQVSDRVASVRWALEKLDCVPQGHPCVIGFAGSMGRAQQARRELEQKTFHANQFKKRHLIQGAFDQCLAPIYGDVKKKNPEPSRPLWEITLAGLVALWAEDEPQVLELEYNGDSCFHDYFHAIGSASDTAYAVYHTLGGKRLIQVDEPKALMAIIRIIRTSVNVEMSGVSEPARFWVVTAAGGRTISEDELQAQLQFVAEWEEKERTAFFEGNWPLPAD